MTDRDVLNRAIDLLREAVALLDTATTAEFFEQTKPTADDMFQSLCDLRAIRKEMK